MTRTIRRQILRVRDDGRTNMYDINGVQWVANDLRLYDLVVYLEYRDNRHEYSHFITTGEADIEDDGTEDEEDELD